MKTTFRWTVALSGLGVVTASVMIPKAGFCQTPTPAPTPTMAKMKVKTTKMTGTITAEDGMNLMVKAKGSTTPTTVAVPDSAAIMQGKKTVTFATLMVGDKVRISMADGTVTRVDIIGVPKPVKPASSTPAATS